MNILVYDVSNLSVYGYSNSTLEETLKKSDIISIHVPLTPETKNLITKKELQKMKNTSLIINTSRGGIINEEDLAWALNSDVIGGAGVDVLTEEPPKSENPLLGDVKNLIITPHIAWSSKEARQRLIDITVENIESFLRGDIKNKVN
jgi:glycerate dehydrogenase